MRPSGLASGLIASLAVPAVVPMVAFADVAPATAPYQTPSEKLLIDARSATTWTDGKTDVAQLEGPVKIELDRATLTARQAVVWIAPDPESKTGGRHVTVALVGDAKVVQTNATRSGERMLVTTDVAGKIQLRAEDRVSRDASDTALFRAARAMLPEPAPATEPRPAVGAPSGRSPSGQPAGGDGARTAAPPAAGRAAGDAPDEPRHGRPTRGRRPRVARHAPRGSVHRAGRRRTAGGGARAGAVQRAGTGDRRHA